MEEVATLLTASWTDPSNESPFFRGDYKNIHDP